MLKQTEIFCKEVKFPISRTAHPLLPYQSNAFFHSQEFDFIMN